MGINTKIDWCEATWNPVTGCLHGCEYCYARRIAERFRPFDLPHGTEDGVFKNINDLSWPIIKARDDGKETIQPYPYGFEPTFHRYRLGIPQRWRTPRNIFVCSMADLFGAWVPDEWIKDVFDACMAAPQHRYLFLTKNPMRYMNTYPWYLSRIQRISKAFEAWFGYSYDGISTCEIRKSLRRQYSLHQFISIEPMMCPIQDDEISMIKATCDWVIIGAETGNRKGRIKPEKRWIMNIANSCEIPGIPVFMKESLREIMGADFRQEFPWGEV